MSRRPSLFVAVALIFTLAVFALPQQAVNADADVSSSVRTCSNFQATGTTDAPYVTIYAYNYDTGGEYFIVIPSSGGTYSGNLAYPAQPEGSDMNFEVWGSLDTYTDFNDPDYWDGGNFFNLDEYCVNASFAGPAVPAGWVQRWMTCSTAVFDAPGGQPIGNNAVWAGQSFFVNPETKTDASGKSWSQVFVSSYNSPWIPTSCVG